MNLGATSTNPVADLDQMISDAQNRMIDEDYCFKAVNTGIRSSKNLEITIEKLGQRLYSDPPVAAAYRKDIAILKGIVDILYDYDHFDLNDPSNKEEFNIIVLEKLLKLKNKI